MNFKIKDIKNRSLLEDEIILRVLKTIESNNMIKKRERILISVSGGPDSTFLTYLFYLLRPALDLTLFGFCLDHMTRDGESTRDAMFVEEMYKKLGIKLFKQKMDVEKWCKLNRFSFEKGARELRIQKLIEVSEKNHIDKIATGHNADDNIETFFMHLLRGAGARGLSGIKPVAGKFIRPLIDIPGEDIISYLAREKISYCVDRTNIESIYFRNRIRNILVPFIVKNFGNSFKKILLRTLFILKDEDDFLNDYSSRRIKKIAYIKKDSNNKNTVLVKISVPELNKESTAIQRRIVMLLIEMINGNLEDISFKNIDDILKICIPGGESKAAQPDINLQALKIGDYLYFINNKYKKLLPGEFKNLFSKKVNMEEKKGRNKKIIVKPGVNMVLKDYNLTLSSTLLKYDSGKIELKEIKGSEALIDYSKVKPPIFIKNWEAGDKFYPLGMDKEKKLQDFFVDNKIPIHLKSSIPVFMDREKIIWVGGYRIDDRVKITGNTREILHLKLF
jgi:tRNA(Ile)-lysidine synthase